MRVLRVLTIAAAVLVCAWFAVGVRQAVNTDRASNTIPLHSTLSPAEAARVGSWLDAAGWLNPDREVDVLRGKLAKSRDDFPGAVQILLGVTRKEPQNLEAWLALSQAALRSPSSRPVFSLAFRQLKILDPRL